MRLEIRKLHARLGVTSLFVTHEQVEAMTMADRLLVMKDWNIEQAGTPDQIYSQPASIYVAGFVGSPPMNLLSVRAIDNPDSNEFAFAILDDNQRLPLAENILPVNQTTQLTAGFRAENTSILNQDGAEINELPNNGYQIVNADRK